MDFIFLTPNNLPTVVTDVDPGPQGKGILACLQNLVGGSIELLPDGHKELLGIPAELDVYINEEGKLIELGPNLVVYDGPEVDASVVDVICGPMVFTRSNAAGEILGVQPEDLTAVKKLRAKGLAPML